MPLGEEFSSTLLVEVNGSPLPADVASLLVSGYVDDSSNVPDLFVLRFSDEGAAVIEKGGFKIGVPVRLRVQTSAPGGPELLLSGEVTALEAEVTQEGQHTVVRGLDLSHRLFRGRRVEAYRNVAAGDVVRKVSQRVGLTGGTIRTSNSPLDHVAQDGVSDWEFLTRLGRQQGCLVSVVDGKLNFESSTSAGGAPSGRTGARENPYVIERGKNLISLRATVTSSDQVPDVEVRGWNVTEKKAVVARAAAATTHAEVGTTPKQLATDVKASTHLAPYAGYESQDQCETTAKALAGHLAGGFAGLEGTVRGNPKLRSGEAVSLIGVGKPFEGRYTLSGTRHEFSPELGYLTSFTVSSDSERSLYGLAAGGAAAGGSPLPGVVSALVTDARDPEKLGRVKVKFPVLSDQYESWWARTLQPAAGAGRGMAMLPEVGDEVLVAFGQNSLQQPYVLGGLYNGKDKPEGGDKVLGGDGRVVRRAFTSRTGMVLEFLEGPDGEKVVVRSKDGKQALTIAQKPDAAVTLVSEGPLDVTAKKDVTVASQSGNITLEATAGNVVVKGQKVSIEALSDLELKGTNVKVDATATVKVAASGTAELTSSGMTTVKGSMVRIN